MKTLYQALLPSGRAVRFRRLATRDYLQIQQRVAAKIGDKKDPGGGLAKTILPVEIVATSLHAITLDPLVWTYLPLPTASAEDVASDDDSVLDALASPVDAPASRQLDVDAMLASADTEKRWMPVTYGEVMRREGPLSFDVLFEDLRDFDQMAALATGVGTADPSKGQGLLGKVQVVSGG